MQDGERLSLEQIRAFLEASDKLRLDARDSAEMRKNSVARDRDKLERWMKN